MADKFDAYDIQIKTYMDESLPIICADPQKITELFTLLFNDEIVNLPPGSSIKLCITKSDIGLSESEAVRIELSDDGPGLPEDSLKSIFDPLFVRNDDSQEFGINLVSVFVIVHNHGGRIEVKNNAPNGVLFKILLPWGFRTVVEFKKLQVKKSANPELKSIR